MLSKNYTIKKGDEWGFNVIFKSVQPDNILFGLKVDYSQENYDVLLTLEDGKILPNGSMQYSVVLNSDITKNLPFENYNFDLRYVSEGRVKTPFAGRITITPTVFDKD